MDLKRNISIISLLLGWGISADAQPVWRLVWNDEFDQPNGAGPSSARWAYDLGGNGWGNAELQTYTSRRQNSRIEDGRLVIEARRETLVGTDSIRRDYTSARLKTQGKAWWTFGRIEARIRLPQGQGIWPAFWMLGTNFPSVSWPQCGEIDIMENIGRQPGTTHGVLHGPGYSGGANVGSSFTLPNGERLADDFRVYAIEWEPNRVRWLVDDRVFFTATPTSLPSGRSWVFNHGFFIILNVAVGGVFPGNPDGTTVFPQQMLVDYVRVYAADPTPPTLQIVGGPDGALLVWPVTLPAPLIERTDLLDASWSPAEALMSVKGLHWFAPVPPGYYRLRW